MNKTVNKKGFSLVELLVVISIIGVLSAVLVANFMGARERARDAQKIQDLNAVKNALRMYYNDNQTYPDSEGANACTGCLNTILLDYIPSVGVVDYWYLKSYDGDSFKLWANLEAGAGDEDKESQRKCGRPENEVVDKVYMVCGN